MVIYGFLTYLDGYVTIPKKELMDKFANMVKQRPGFGYMYRLAVESGRSKTGNMCRISMANWVRIPNVPEKFLP